MAIQKTAQWWIRTDGDDLNGGGFDIGISGSGTNYCDQATAQLALTNCATSGIGSTTLTTASGGFTSNMIGNSIRLSSGTNLTLGDYFIVGYTSSGEVTLDRAPDNGGGGVSGAVGRVGGAWRSLEYTSTTVATPCPMPQVAGNVTNLRGDGSYNPTTIHYQMTNYRTFRSGNITDGMCALRGYNGLAHIGTGPTSALWCHNTSYLDFHYLKITSESAGNPGYGLSKNPYSTNYRCIFNMNGFNGIGATNTCIQCLFDCTGISSSTYHAWHGGQHGHTIDGCIVLNHTSVTGVAAVRGGNIGSVNNNLIVSPTVGIFMASQGYMEQCSRNTIVGADVGIQLDYHIANQRAVFYNLIANCNTGIETTSSNETSHTLCNHFSNAYYNNTVNYSNVPPGDGDYILASDPFVDAANGNYALKNGVTAGAYDAYADVPGYSGDTSNFISIGAVQSNYPNVDTRYRDSSEAGYFYPFRPFVADSFYVDTPTEGTSEDFQRDYDRKVRPFYRFEIGDNRQFKTLNEFHDAYSNTLIDQPHAEVLVVIYNDAGQNEFVVSTGLNWTNQASNVTDITITVDDDSWHKGREGYGVVIRPGSAVSSILTLNFAANFVFERVFIDANNQLSNNSTILNIGNTHTQVVPHRCFIKDIIVRGGDGTYNPSARSINGIYSEARPVYLENCIVYNLLSSGSATGSQTIGISRDDDMYCKNCLVYNLDFTNSTNSVPCLGFYGMSDVAYGGLHDCIALEVNGECVNSSVNVQSCVTDDGTGTLSSTAAAEFVDAANGDFRLRSGSVAAGTGPQLTSAVLSTDITGKLKSSLAGVTTDAGPFNNVAGYDIDVIFPGEEEATSTPSTYADGPGTRVHPFRQFTEGRATGVLPSHPLRSS